MTVATLFPTMDAQMAVSGMPDGIGGTTSAATATEFKSGNPDSCSNAWSAAIFQFDVSSLPVGTGVQSATLGFTVNASTANTGEVRAFKNTTSWVEVDSVAGPNYSLADRTAAMTGVAGTGLKTLTDAAIAAWVEDWLNFPSGNFGLSLAFVNPIADGRYMTIDSREFAGTTSDPYLSVTYGYRPTITPTGVPGGSVPLAGNVPISYSYSDPDANTIAQVAIRRKRLTGA